MLSQLSPSERMDWISRRRKERKGNRQTERDPTILRQSHPYHTTHHSIHLSSPSLPFSLMSFLHSWHGRRNPAPTPINSPSPSTSSSSLFASSSSGEYFLQAVKANGRTAYLDLVHPSRPHSNSRLLTPPLTLLRTPARTDPTDASDKQTHSHQRNHTNTNTNTTTKHAILPHMEDLDDEILALGYEKAMIAGAAAGAVEHIFMFPVDTIKTRLQVVQTSS